MAGLSKTFETLTEDVVVVLATHLEPLELIRLGATCKGLQQLFNQQELWEQYVRSTVL